MNPQIDFSDAKRVISNLAQYITQKQNNINNIGNQTVVTQEMSLASQPELQSDHLVEEAELIPEGISTATETTNVDIGYNSPGEIQESTAVNNGQSLDSGYVDGTPQLIPMPSIEPMAGNLEVQPQPQATSTMLDTSAAALTADAQALVSGDEYLSQSNGLEATSQPSDISQEPAFVSTMPQDGNNIQPVAGVEPGIDTKVIPDNGDIPIIEPIPDVSVPQGDLGSEGPSEYVAVGTGATVLPEQTQELAQEPVIMPTGVTSDIANNQDLVITPTSFGQTL